MAWKQLMHFLSLGTAAGGMRSGRFLGAMIAASVGVTLASHLAGGGRRRRRLYRRLVRGVLATSRRS